jgi:channel protein (hemolysin III family)
VDPSPLGRLTGQTRRPHEDASRRGAPKLILPGLGRKLWIALYLALGWLVLVALKPMIDNLSWIALFLLALGSLVYSTGAFFCKRCSQAT